MVSTSLPTLCPRHTPSTHLNMSLYPGQWSAATWARDNIKDGLVNVRATSLSWLSSMTGSVLHILTTPVYWLLSTLTNLGVTLAAMISTLASCLQAPFLWIMGGAISEQTVQDKVMFTPEDAQQMQDLQSVAAKSVVVSPELDIELVSKQVLESDAFKTLQLQLAAQRKQDQQQPIMVDMSASQFAQLGEELRQLRKELLQLRQSAGLHPRHAALHREVQGLERRIRVLQMQQLGERCCDKVEEQVAGVVAALFGQAGDTLTPAEVAALVSSKLEALGQVESRLDKFASDINLLHQKSFSGTSEPAAGAEVHMVGGMSEDQVRSLVREALAIYDADKTNVVDYALETSGGTILSTRCTENYDYKHGVTFYWGLSWLSKEYRPNNPRAIIQPSVNPGECWAFKGATGYVVIQLSTRINVMAVTMEHVPRTLTPFGSIESAPKDFRVLGLQDLNDPSPVLLGKFRYEDKNEPLQMFQVETSHHKSFQRIELQIESNHGHLEYTCVYRFRVHGVPAPIS